MSLENLFKILPNGVVSKNFIGLLTIFKRRSLWIVFAAIMLPKATDKDIPRTDKTDRRNF